MVTGVATGTESLPVTMNASFSQACDDAGRLARSNDSGLLDCLVPVSSIDTLAKVNEPMVAARDDEIDLQDDR